jgi:hypothetical protein
MKATIASAVLLILVGAAPAFAHHAFAVEFDAKNCMDITGVLTKVSYENPHAYLYVTSKGPDGQAVPKTFQLSSTSNLKRGGATLPILNASLNKEVIVRGCSSRNGEDNRYAASFIRLADGTIQRLGQDVEGIFGQKIWK